MHNDDSTLIIIEHDGFDDFNCANIDDVQSLITEEKKRQEILEQQPKETAKTTPTIEEVIVEPHGEIAKEVHPSVKPNLEEHKVTPISEDEFVKIILDSYHYLERSTSKWSKIKRTISRNEVNVLLRNTVQTAYKKLNITKK